MLAQYYTWCVDHQVIIGVIGFALTAILGLVNLGKLKMLAFTASQLIRKTLGKGVEKKLEDIVDAIDEGLKSDNDK